MIELLDIPTKAMLNKLAEHVILDEHTKRNNVYWGLNSE